MNGLLALIPTEWKIREQTVREIWGTFPTMTRLEFKRSLLHLVEQTKSTRQRIKTPAAWLKAAFQNAGGPLVTERDIERQLDTPLKKRPAAPQNSPREEDEELSVLRRYLATDPEIRAKIDALAEERTQRLLTTLSADKREGVLEQARLEVAQEVLRGKS